MKEGFRWTVRIRMYDGEDLIYGRGVSQLLIRTAELGSLNRAAKALGMSYKKALQIVTRAEEGLGAPLITRSIGGAGGGGSALTPFGEEFVGRFHLIEEEVEAFTSFLGEKYFPNNQLTVTKHPEEV